MGRKWVELRESGGGGGGTERDIHTDRQEIGTHTQTEAERMREADKETDKQTCKMTETKTVRQNNRKRQREKRHGERVIYIYLFKHTPADKPVEHRIH